MVCPGCEIALLVEEKGTVCLLELLLGSWLGNLLELLLESAPAGGLGLILRMACLSACLPVCGWQVRQKKYHTCHRRCILAP